MKNLTLIAMMAFSGSVLSSERVDAAKLSQYTIQDSVVMQSVSFAEVTSSQNIQKGQVLTGEHGLEAYQSTGEVIVKLASFADAAKLAKAHNLVLKQAYADFYIVTAKDGNLKQVIDKLSKDGTVVSASIDFRDLGVGIE